MKYDKSITNIIIHTDGGSRNNPGQAAIGAVISSDKGVLGKYGERLGIATNNEAEYQAVVFALKKTKALFGKQTAKKMNVEVKTDSELIAKQLNGQYKVSDPKIQILFLTVWNLKLDFKSVNFVHIPREENKEADSLVNEALDDLNRNQKMFQ